MPEQILELSDLAPKRPKARLRTEADPEGQVYELAIPQDFGAVALSRLGHLIAQTDELWETPKLTKAQEKHLEQLLNRVARILIRGAPPKAVAALPADTKHALGSHFLVRASERRVRLFAELAEASKASKPSRATSESS